MSRHCAPTLGHARRVPVPADVRADCVALCVQHGSKWFRRIGIGEHAAGDLVALGGAVMPELLERVKAKLSEVRDG